MATVYYDVYDPSDPASLYRQYGHDTAKGEMQVGQIIKLTWLDGTPAGKVRVSGVYQVSKVIEVDTEWGEEPTLPDGRIRK